MMKLRNIAEGGALVCASILLAVMTMVVCTSCQTKLDPGPYEGDAVLFRAEQAIVETKDAMDTFLKWEHQNQAVLAAYPEIKQYADVVRVDGRVWLESAIALRNTYKANPNDETRGKLQTSLALLRTMLAEIATHLARHKATVAPNQ